MGETFLEMPIMVVQVGFRPPRLRAPLSETRGLKVFPAPMGSTEGLMEGGGPISSEP